MPAPLTTGWLCPMGWAALLGPHVPWSSRAAAFADQGSLLETEALSPTFRSIGSAVTPGSHPGCLGSGPSCRLTLAGCLASRCFDFLICEREVVTIELFTGCRNTGCIPTPQGVGKLPSYLGAPVLGGAQARGTEWSGLQETVSSEDRQGPRNEASRTPERRDW